MWSDLFKFEFFLTIISKIGSIISLILICVKLNKYIERPTFGISYTQSEELFDHFNQTTLLNENYKLRIYHINFEEEFYFICEDTLLSDLKDFSKQEEISFSYDDDTYKLMRNVTKHFSNLFLRINVTRDIFFELEGFSDDQK